MRLQVIAIPRHINASVPSRNWNRPTPTIRPLAHQVRGRRVERGAWSVEREAGPPIYSEGPLPVGRGLLSAGGW